MAQNTPQKDNSYQRVEFKEFIKISRWVVDFVFSISPGYTAIFVFLYIVNNLKGILNTFLFSKLIDQAITISTTNGTISQMYPMIGILFGYNLLSMGTSFLYRYVDIRLDFIMEPIIQQRMYLKIKELGIQTLEQPEINNKLHRTKENLYNTSDFFTRIIGFISSVVSLIVTSALLIGSLPIMIPLVILVSLPRYFIDKKYRMENYKVRYENTEELRKSEASSTDLTTPAKLQEVFINGAFGFFDRKYMRFVVWYFSERTKFWKKFMTTNFSFSVLGTVINFGSYIILLSRLIAKSMSIGTFYFQTDIVSRFQDQVTTISSTYNDITEFVTKVKDTYLLFQTKPAFEDGTIELPKLQKGPSIEFKNVNFTYPNAEKSVLKDINFSIKSGEKLAIVGHNGAGKTTLVRLLCRLYKVNSGAIFIDGNDINNISAESLYKNYGVLFQDFNLHPQLTVAENIQAGNPDLPYNEEAIIKAAENADALKFIYEYPKKFDQILGERYKGGIRPSTGQWQKIAIARFFYRNAPLVIFDEPTAAIDPVSEYNIFNKIYEFFRDKTVIIISHKFSTVRNADRIMVIDNGEVAEDGTHEQLLRKEGLYAKAFNLQAEGYKN